MGAEGGVRARPAVEGRRLRPARERQPFGAPVCREDPGRGGGARAALVAARPRPGGSPSAPSGGEARALRSSRLAPEALELEVTETVVMQNPAQAAQTLDELKALRVGLSLDDFGIGYSSLSYLKMFPFDALKIDRAFVAGIPADREDVAIAEAVIHLAHALNIRAIAEGVETDDQVQWLCKFGCEELQGDLLAKAMPSEELAALFLKPDRRIHAIRN